MSRRLTWDEIQKEYPDQWVGLIDVERDGIDIVSASSMISSSVGTYFVLLNTDSVPPLSTVIMTSFCGS